MARQARKISPTEYYHVMLTGNNLQRAQAIIEEFRSAAGKSEAQGILRLPFYSDELIIALLKGSGLSYRRIAL